MFQSKWLLVLLQGSMGQTVLLLGVLTPYQNSCLSQGFAEEKSLLTCDHILTCFLDGAVVRHGNLEVEVCVSHINLK